MAASTLNKNNSAVKRIMQEARELANDPCTDYGAGPLEDDIFEWHCTLRGPAGTEFEGGLYHFRILLPAEYPFRPPSLMMLTPNGRFELNTKICISFTSYHEELWQPAWGVRTAIVGLQGFFPLKGQAAVGVGSVEYPASERKRLAALSREWVCPRCNQSNLELLPDPPPSNTSTNTDLPSTSSPIDESSPVKASEKDALSSEVTVVSVSENGPSPEGTSKTDDGNSTTIFESEVAMHNSIDVVVSPASNEREGMINVRRESFTVGTRGDAGDVIRTVRRRTDRPPVILDTAICVLLVIVFGIICRRLSW